MPGHGERTICPLARVAGSPGRLRVPAWWRVQDGLCDRKELGALAPRRWGRGMRPLRTWNERLRDMRNATDFGWPMRWSDAIYDPNIDMQRVTATMLGMDPDAPDDEPRDP